MDKEDSWTPVEKQDDITPVEVQTDKYPGSDETVLVTVEDVHGSKRSVTCSGLVPKVGSPNYTWPQTGGPVRVVAWKETPEPYTD